MAEVEANLITIAQLVEEDDDYALLRVAKHKNASFTVEEGDKFFTMMFVRQDGSKEGHLLPYHPFWHEDPEHFKD